MEIVHVFIADLRGDFIDFEIRFIQQLGGPAHAQRIQVGIEADAGLLGEKLSQIGAVVAEERGHGFQLQRLAVIVGNVVDDIVKDAVAGVVADGADDHFELFGKEQQDLIKILFIFDGLENVRIGVKRYLDAFVAGKDGRLYFQENIGEEIFDFPDILSAVVKHEGCAAALYTADGTGTPAGALDFRAVAVHFVYDEI